MKTLSNLAVLVARIFIFAWFLPAGLEKISGYAATAGYMTSQGVPGWLLPLVIVTEIGGAIFLLFGWRTRLVAFLMAGYTLLAVLLFHLHPSDETGKIIQMAELVDAGGFLILFAHGAGDWSLDGWLARRRAAKALH